MVKPSGLPSTFDIGATKDDLGASSVQLGDYLDESLRRGRPARIEPDPALDPQPRTTASTEPVTARTELPPRVVHLAVDQDEASKQQALGARRGVAPASLRPTKQTRLQINLSIEGVKAHNDLMSFIQSRSRQRDVKHAEVYQALAMALCEALPYLDLKSVPERGAWGSPTARSFVSALKTTIVRAIGELHASEHRQ